MKFPFPSTRVPGTFIDKISASEVAEAAKFLTKFWDSDSPIPNILRYEKTALQHQWNEAFVKHRLATGVCLKAVTDNGEMVGTVMSKVFYKDTTNDPTEQELDRLSSKLPKIQIYDSLVKKLFDEADMFSKYGVNCYLDLGRTYMIPELRRKSLSRELNYTLVAEAQRSLGVELFVVGAVSAYSQRAYTEDKKYAFELVHQIDYSTYKVGDEYPFKNDGIHQRMQLFAKLIPLRSRQADKENSNIL